MFLILSWPAISRAQESNLVLPGGQKLTVEGDEFIFEQVYVDVDGEQVLQERAIWDGNVVAQFQDIRLETGHIVAIFDGEQVSRLEAGPLVDVTGYMEKAHFECRDMVIDFPTSEADAGVYTGICTDVKGSITASPADFGYELDEEYQINFVADCAELGPETATLDHPILSLGNIDDPDLAVLSRSVTFTIGYRPGTDQRAILRLVTENLSVSIFGNRLNIIPFQLRRSFYNLAEPGFSYPIPKMGIESDGGFHIAPTVVYDFVLDGFDEGPQLGFTLDIFPVDRTYPELWLDAEKDGFLYSIRTGYRREEDSEGNTVPTRAEPEITIGTTRTPLGDSGFNGELFSFWGHMRDMTLGTDLDRWGYGAGLMYTGIEYNDFTLTGAVNYLDRFYEGGQNYSTLESQVRLRYVDYPRWGAAVTYRHITDWGSTPFRFDIPRYMEEIGFREQTRLSDRWGAGFDLRYDLKEDELAHHEYHLTYILDSFQVSLGWDFADSTVTLSFGLPGSLR